MTNQQLIFIEEVILPQLIEMAENDNLPLDLNDLSAYHFEKRAIEFNAGGEEKCRLAYEEAAHYLCSTDDYSIEEQVKQIYNTAMNDRSLKKRYNRTWIDDVHGVQVWEKIEYAYTCEDFLELIGFPLLFHHPFPYNFSK